MKIIVIRRTILSLFLSSTRAQTPYLHQGSWAFSGQSTFAVQSKSPSTTSATRASKWSERTANSTTSVQTEACEPPEGLMGPPVRQRWRQSPQWRWRRWTPMSSCTCGPSTTCKLLIGHQGAKCEYMIKFREELPVVNTLNTTSRMKSSFDLKSLFLQLLWICVDISASSQVFPRTWVWVEHFVLSHTEVLRLTFTRGFFGHFLSWNLPVTWIHMGQPWTTWTPPSGTSGTWASSQWHPQTLALCTPSLPMSPCGTTAATSYGQSTTKSWRRAWL